MSEGVLSFDQAIGKAPATPEPPPPGAPQPKGGVLSFSEATGTKPAKTVEQSPGFFVKGAKKAFADGREFWTALSDDIVEQQKQGQALMSQGKQDMRGEQLQGLKGVGETLIGAFQWSTAGMSALWDQTVTKDVHYGVDKATQGVGKFLPEKSSSPWVVTKGELARAGDNLADFTDTLLQVSLGGGGAAKTLSKEALELVPKEMRAEMAAREARNNAKAESAFDELIVADPPAAKHVAESVGKFSPEMQKVFDKRWAKFVKASDKELDQVGVAAAKQNIEEIEGKLPDISKLQRAKADPSIVTEKGQVPRDVSPEVTEAQRNANMLKRAELIAAENSKAAEKGAMPSAKPSPMGNLLNSTRDLFVNNEDYLNDIAHSRGSAGAHEILDTFAKSMPNGPTKDIVTRLRKYVPDIKISYKDKITGMIGDKEMEVGGLYFPKRNEIEVHKGFHQDGMNSAQVILHELTHAATARVLEKFDFNEKEDLTALLKVARDRFNAHPYYSKQPRFYGLTDEHEFLAEAVSSPEFQRFLINSESTGIGKFQNIFDAIVSKIATALGLAPESTPLFHNIMKTGERIMRLQQEHPEMIKDAYGERAYASPPPEFDFAKKPRVGEIAKGKGREYWDGILRNLAPEALSKQAKLGGAYIAKAIAGLAHDDSTWTHKSFDRKLYWARNKDKAAEFISRFEKGEAQRTPELARIAKAYEGWATRIMQQDRRAGVKEYEGVDHYVPRVFDNPEEVERYLENKYGSSWRAPGFAKDRSFEYLDDAIKAGFKPKFTNIEDMFLARQHASDIAEMKLEIMSDLSKNGLAVEKSGGKPPSPVWHSRPAPNGKTYWVHPDVSQILSNAFDSKSLWSLKGLAGDAFRGAMGLKNTLVPLKLFGSLFHPLHVATIHNATELTRASASMLAGTDDPVTWLGRMVRGAVPLYHSVADTPGGYRLLQAFKGQAKSLTSNDIASLKLMQEGGFIPEMSSQYRTKSIEKFRLAAAEGNLSAAWHLPWAGLQLIQKPIFEQWIPSLKISSYLKDAAEWMKRNPTASDQERILALRKVSKSVDNRYGEMAYNTLFWKRYMKDIAVADTLSLGWNLGFLREYGGGLLDMGKAVANPGGAAKSGLLDRPLFVALYTGQALAYGGLMNWAMSGQAPQGFMDYIYPRNGEKTADGKDARVQTMFYTREFGALYKHAQAEGVASGVTETVLNKGSGLMALATEAVKGVNEWGEQIRGNGPLYQQIEQTLGHMLKELEPISLSAIKGPMGANKETGLAVAGFTPAGKYVTQTATQGRIDSTYNKVYAPRETPYDKAQYSEEARNLRRYWETDQMDKYDAQLEKMQETYKLTGPEVRKLTRGLQRGDDPTVQKFSHFSIGDQTALLDKMTPEEREKYLPHANKKLRREYEEPTE